MSIAYFADLLRTYFEGRKFILIGGPVVGFRDMIRQLRGLGAERPLIIGSTLGTGPSDDGGFLAFTPSRDRIDRGPSVAPRVSDAFRVADQDLGVPLGPLEPARSVR